MSSSFAARRPGNLHPQHPRPTIRPSFPGHGFQPLPAPTGAPPFHLDLADVLGPEKIKNIQDAGKMVCHIIGDTGGVKKPEPQQLVADGMEKDSQQTDPDSVPAFCYHLGDVVYFNGEINEYLAQFYEPYEHYDAPIIAIPGNHDADPLPGSTSLEGFLRNFCAKTATPTHENGGTSRPAMTEPNVYFTLLTPLATFIGLYTNVPEGGQVQPDQEDWFVKELKNAPKDVPLFIAMHHPVYSLDNHHSGSQHMHDLITRAIAASKRKPEMVFAGHVHNYQRFTQKDGNRETPFIVAGGGGYWHLHNMAKINNEPIIPPYVVPDSDVILENYAADRHGFLRLEITADLITGRYFTVPRPQESWSAPPKLEDFFQFDWKQRKLNR